MLGSIYSIINFSLLFYVAVTVSLHKTFYSYVTYIFSPELLAP